MFAEKEGWRIEVTTVDAIQGVTREGVVYCVTCMTGQFASDAHRTLTAFTHDTGGLCVLTSIDWLVRTPVGQEALSCLKPGKDHPILPPLEVEQLQLTMTELRQTGIVVPSSLVDLLSQAIGAHCVSRVTVAQ